MRIEESVAVPHTSLGISKRFIISNEKNIDNLPGGLYKFLIIMAI